MLRTLKIFLNILGLSDKDTLTKEDCLDENCLDLYIMSEHIKKKTAMFTSMRARFPWILEHNCHLVKFWELFMLIIVLYISIIYPYFIGFSRKFPEGLPFFAEVIITIALIVNMFISALTSIKTKKIYVRNVNSILNYRLKTLGFYLDLLAIIPFEYLVIIDSEVNYNYVKRDHLFYFCKGVKLCLIWRISKFFESMERKLLCNLILIKVNIKINAYQCRSISLLK